MIICKRFTFEAAHSLPGYDGPCANVHGHSYKLEIGVEGPVSNSTGMVLDFKQLKEVVNEEVIRRLDHTLLNKRIDNPTCENTISWIYDQLHSTMGSTLILIRLWETEDCYAEWRS